MQENTKHRSRKTTQQSPFRKMLDNIFFTKQLLDEYSLRRENMRNLLTKCGIRYEYGQYFYEENASEDVIFLARQAQDIEENIVKNTSKLLKNEKAVTNLISKIPDYRSRLLLIKRFIDDKSIEIIADEMNYSPRHVQRMIKDAEEVIEKIYEEEMQKLKDNRLAEKACTGKSVN